MTVTPAQSPQTFDAEIEQMDLHLGVVFKPGHDDEKFVAVMLQPRGARITEKKVGAMVADWPSLFSVVSGMVSQGTEAWGPMPSGLEQWQQLLFRMGELAGALTIDEHHDRLVTQLETGALKAAYVTLLRDQLTRALRDSGREPHAVSDARIVEIRDQLLPGQGERFDCIAFARAVLRESGREA